jgi:hypothetical protein
MTKTVAAILKKSQSRAGGQASLPRAAAPSDDGPHACILEMHDDRAVIEVRCGCGKHHYVECRWTRPAQAATAPQRKNV